MFLFLFFEGLWLGGEDGRGWMHFSGSVGIPHDGSGGFGAELQLKSPVLSILSQHGSGVFSTISGIAAT